MNTHLLYCPLFSVPFLTLKTVWLKKKPRFRKATTPFTEESNSEKTYKIKALKPRPRKRRGKGAKLQSSTNPRPTVVLSSGDGDEYISNADGRSTLPGVLLRMSNRWYPAPSERKVRDIPFIDKLGRNTGTSVYKWTCTSAQYVATITSTIFSRLKWYACRHNDYRLVIKNQERLLKVSYYYAVSNNNYLWDRVLYFSRNLEKYGTLIHRSMIKFLKKTDDYIRFVYSQVSFQTHWLSFRAERPRDKSETKDITRQPDKRWFSRGVGDYCKTHCIDSIAKAMAPIRGRYLVIKT